MESSIPTSPKPNHGEAIISHGQFGNLQKRNNALPAHWSVKDLLDGANKYYTPVRVKRSKKHGIVWMFKSDESGSKTWWQTCNEEPVIAELMAAQFKKRKEKK